MWLSAEVFQTVVKAATMAPSMHNTQPWRFRLQPDAVELLADPQRRLPVEDPTGWGLRLGCGAALFNLRLALLVAGSPATVELLPDPDSQELLARLTPGPHRPPTPTEDRLRAAIVRRHSNRYPFLDQPVPSGTGDELVAAAQAEGAWLDLVVGPEAVDSVASLVREADEALLADPAYRAELAIWVRAGRAADGISGPAAGPSPRPYELLARRDFGGAQLPAHREFEREPLIGVLGSVGDWPSDQLMAGQALQRVLLTATDLGLAASMFSQPIEVDSVREQLRTTLRREFVPQMVLRFGYAAPAPSSPRRPVSEVTQV